MTSAANRRARARRAAAAGTPGFGREARVFGTPTVVSLFLSLFMASAAATPARAVTIDRVAAVVERQVLTVSEISQMVEIRFFPRTAATEDDHRREVLDALIAQALRFGELARYGAQDISADAIEARLEEIERRFATEADFLAAVARAELTLDEVRALVRRQLQIEAYVQEQIAPRVFVSPEDIEAYYRGPWSAQRRERGLGVPPLAEVRAEIRAAVRSSRLQEEIASWTAQLRTRANVDVYAWR